MSRALRDDFLCNGIRGKKRTEAQQIRRFRTLQLHFLQGERQGFGHGIWMMSKLSTTTGQQNSTTLAITIKIAPQAALRFLKVSASLIEGQWQSAQLLTDRLGHHNISDESIREASISGHKTSTT